MTKLKKNKNKLISILLVLVLLIVPSAILWGYKYNWEINPSNLGRNPTPTNSPTNPSL